MWKFDSNDKSSLRNVIFRSTKADGLQDREARIIFEFVVYCKAGDNNGKVSEMCCGWCELPIGMIASKSLDLEIKGGSPYQEIEIKKDELRADRTGFAAFKKALGGVKSQLVVDVKEVAKFEKEVKFHLDLMPSTCLVHKALLYFISGFVNYKADKLLKDQTGTGFRKPSGDLIMSAFPAILDNQEILEALTPVWCDKMQVEINEKRKQDIAFIVQKTVEVISKLYTVIHSPEPEKHVKAVLTGQPDLFETRPFTMRELNYNDELVEQFSILKR